MRNERLKNNAPKTRQGKGVLYLIILCEWMVELRQKWYVNRQTLLSDKKLKTIL